MPTQDESILFQRHLIRDMCTAGEKGRDPRRGSDKFACHDPWYPDKVLTRAELFDQHALCMLVINEVEAREKGTA